MGAKQDNATDMTAAYEFELSGGSLCLDFTNTVGDRPRQQEEHLRSYLDLLTWSRQSGVLDRRRQRRVARQAQQESRRAVKVFTEAIELRECLYRIFSALAVGTEPTSEDLARLNSALAATLGHLSVERNDQGFGWGWAGSEDALDQMLWPVVRSAADLLTSEEASLVRECASESCSWLFVDRSRTHRRRWCDMKTCGNRAKARRHYQRHRLRAEKND